MEPETQTCRKCGKPKALSTFLSKQRNGHVIHRTVCAVCRHSRSMPSQLKYLERCKTDGRRRAYYIKSDSRKTDALNGRQNDLDLQFIRETISKPCVYCDRHELKIMTLDRINNSIGHTKTNVVPSCMRCNSTRNTMPYEAWLVVSKWMKKATELDLFSGWEGPWQ